MNKLTATILITFSFVSAALAQEYTIDSNYADWRYLFGDNYFYLYNDNGDGIENFDKIPFFEIMVNKDKYGIYKLRLSGAKLYPYDYSENDANYYDVDIIIDEGDTISYTGKLNPVVDSDITRIFFLVPKNEPEFTDLFAMMKSGNTISIQTNRTGKLRVFKYNLNGFTKGLNKLTQSWIEWKEDNKNLFDN